MTAAESDAGMLDVGVVPMFNQASAFRTTGREPAMGLQAELSLEHGLVDPDTAGRLLRGDVVRRDP
jgi:hypothetical protein